MNILIDELPRSVTIDGDEFPVNYGFRTFVLIEICIFDTKLSDSERVNNALELFYGDRLPDDISAAFERMMWFYRGGKDEKKAKSKGSSNAKRCYCFEQDAPYIYSAFRTQYNLDLQDVSSTDLHWWKFKAMFEALNEDLRISKIMSYRVTDTTGMDKHQKKFYGDMKKLYALESESTGDSKMALAKRDADMLRHVRQKFAEVGDAKES